MCIFDSVKSMYQYFSVTINVGIGLVLRLQSSLMFVYNNVMACTYMYKGCREGSVYGNLNSTKLTHAGFNTFP